LRRFRPLLSPERLGVVTAPLPKFRFRAHARRAKFFVARFSGDRLLRRLGVRQTLSARDQRRFANAYSPAPRPVAQKQTGTNCGKM
jgi:hypothetical protein